MSSCTTYPDMCMYVFGSRVDPSVSTCFPVWGLEFGVWGFGVWGVGCRKRGFGVLVSGSGFRVQGGGWMVTWPVTVLGGLRSASTSSSDVCRAQHASGGPHTGLDTGNGL